MRNPLETQARVTRLVRKRRRIRRLKIGSLAIGALILAAAAAFGIDQAVIAARHLSAKIFPPTPSTSAPKSTTTSSTSTTTVPPGPSCSAPGMSAVVYDWQRSGSNIYEVVALLNTTSAPCSVYGYPDVAVPGSVPGMVPETKVPGLGVAPGSAAAGSTTTYPASTPGATTTAVPTTTSASAPDVLSQGQRAWFELSFSDTCSASAPGGCLSATALSVTLFAGQPPIALGQPQTFTFGAVGFEVGPVQGGTIPSAPVVPGG